MEDSEEEVASEEASEDVEGSEGEWKGASEEASWDVEVSEDHLKVV